MRKLFLLIDDEGKVLAIYDNKDLAERLKPAIESRLNVELTLEERILNPELKMVGVKGMSQKWVSVKSLLLVSFFSLFLTACSDFKAAQFGSANVDPAFDTLLEKYKDDKFRFLGTREIQKIDILFYTQDSPVIGECIVSGDSRIILIDPAFWFYASLNDQITLLDHELGHCDLNIRVHATTNTIMNAYHLSGYDFNLNPDFYLHELFVNRR